LTQQRTKDLIPFAALSASYFAHVGFFNPYLSLWLKDIGLSLFAISLINALPPATRLFTPYLWGWLADHTGKRNKVMRYCASVALVGALGLCFQFLDQPWGLWWLLGTLLLLFLHNSAIMPMTEAALSHLVSQGGGFDARRYGQVRLWGSLGFLLTVLLAGWWFELFGLKHFPYWSATLMAVVVLSVWALPEQKEVTHDTRGALLEPSTGQAAAAVWPVLRLPQVQWFFASIFFHVLSHMSIYVFFSLYLDHLGYSKAVIGAMWGFAVVTEIGWFYTQGRWLPRISLTGWLVVVALACVLRMGVTAALAPIAVLVFAAQALHALTFAAHHTVCAALLSHYFPGRLRGRGQALYVTIAYGVPGVLGSLLGGVLVTRFGLGSVFWASMLTSAVAAGCAWRVWRFEHPPVVG
jgi:MFS transporter, PPP family, 3-phenylpropionic acid transporter